MQRREFLAASAAAAIGLSTTRQARAADDSKVARQYYELRTYHFATPAKMQAYGEFLEKSAVPALNRAGIEPVGIFKLAASENPSLKLAADPLELRVLLPHNSIESVLALESKLAADEAFQTEGKAILRSTKADSAFSRYDSSLLLAMESSPRLIKPDPKPDTRAFELRTYESPNQERAKNKLEMFNAGEIPLFVKSGIPGVFFGGAVAGPGMPQLTYMIIHAKFEDAKANWAKFFQFPEWKALSGNASYKDNVSKVISLFIRPAAGSQV